MAKLGKNENVVVVAADARQPYTQAVLTSSPHLRTAQHPRASKPP